MMKLCKIGLFASFLLLTIAFIAPPVLAETPPSAQNTITVETIPGQTVTEKVVQKAHDSWPWYLVRGSGIIAAISLVLLMLSGIGQITGYTYKFLQPLTAWASHRALGIVFGVSVLVHMFGLLFDHFLPFTIWHILVPWLSDFHPVTIYGVHLGSFYLALGIISFYLTIIVVVTSLVWVEKKPHLWKWLHLLSYLVMVLVFVHALYLGTDIAHGWVRTAWLACAFAVAVAMAVRLRRAFTA